MWRWTSLNWTADLAEVGRIEQGSQVDIAAWLADLGLAQYEQAIRDNAVDPEVLRRLTADDPKDLGVVPAGHSRKLLAAIAALGAAGGITAAPRPLTTAPLVGERRHVTVLFADLVLSQELDAKALHALVTS